MTFTIRVTGGVDRNVQGGAEKLVTTLEKGEAQAKRTGEAIVRGARQGSSSLSQTERSAGQARDAMGRFTRDGSSSMARLAGTTGALTGEINRLALAVGAVFTARAGIGLLDGYTQISNRLNTIAKDVDNLNGLIEASHGIAQDTYTDWKVTTEAVVRFTNATKELGVSQREVLDFTTTLNKAILLSGASSSEATNGLIQLSQGLASGALRGDELRSVMENLPYVAQVLAKGMGKTIGELRKLGGEGKITAKEVYEAFVKAAPEIEAKFGKIVPTITQNFTKLRNEATKFFGETATGAGIMRALSDAFDFVIKHFDTFAKVALGVGQALLGLYVIEKIIVMVKALTVAIAANPLGALLVALTVGISLLRQFGDQMETSNTTMVKGQTVIVTVGDYLRALWDQIKALGAAIYDFVSGAWQSLTAAFGAGLDGTGIEFTLRNVLMFIAAWVDGVISIFRALGKTIYAVFAGIPQVIGEGFVKLAQDIVSTVQTMLNAVIKAYNFVDSEINGSARRRKNAAIRDDEESSERAALLRYVNSGRDPSALGINPQVRDGNPFSAADVARDMATRPTGIGGSLSVETIAKLRQLSGMAPRTDPDGGGLAMLDLSFKNPLEGSGQQMKDRLSATWGEEFGSITAQTFVDGWIKGLDADARKKAAERVAAQAAAGTIGTDKGKKGKIDPTKEQLEAAKKLAKELDAIRSASDPVTEAQMKLAKAVDVTDRALKAGVITMAEANQIVSDTAAKTADAREPLLAWRREIEAETAALGMSNGERERANAIFKATEDLRKAGLVIDEKVRASIEHEIDLQRSAAAAAKYNEERQRDLQSTLDRIKGPTDDYNRGLEITKQLLSDGAITSHEYESEIRKLELAYLSGSEAGKTFEGGLRRGLLGLRDEITDVGSQIEATLRNAFRGVEDAIVSLVTTGEINFKKMINAMLADLTRLMIKQAVVGLISSFAGGGYSSALGTDATQGFAGLYGSAPGYAHGGEFIARGGGGIDTNLFAMRLNDGEHVKVTPAGEAPSSSGEPVNLTVVNVYSDAEMDRYMEKNGERIVMNVLRRAQPALRGPMTGR